MSEIRLHRTVLLRPFAGFLAQVGSDIEGALSRSRLPRSAVCDENTYVPSQRFYQFLTDMARRERIEDLGLHAGRYLGANSADPGMTRLLAESLTMRTGLAQACAVMTATVSQCVTDLIPSPDRRAVWLVHRPSSSIHNPANEHIVWFGLCILLDLVRAFAGRGWQPNEIGIRGVRQPGAAARDHFGDPVIRFCPQFSYISIPVEHLCFPPVAATSSKRTDAAVSYRPVPTDEIEAIEQVLKAYVFHDLGLDKIAAVLNTSPRSLQRRLQRGRTSYSRLVRRVKFDAAREGLRDEGLAIAELARALGYRHPTDFSRAFRKIAGITPRQYRDAALRKRIVH